MSNILAIKSSALGRNSVSGRLVEATVADLLKDDPQSRVVHRDVGAEPLPHFDGDSAAALGGNVANAAQRAYLARSAELVAELKAADTLVIGAPMYNFGIPSTLKSWFDHVLRAGITFQYGETGPVGLLKGKRAIVVLTRGGLYSEGAAKALDAQEPHLRTMLGFIGITDVTFVRAEKLAMGAESAKQAVDAALGDLRKVVAEQRQAA